MEGNLEEININLMRKRSTTYLMNLILKVRELKELRIVDLNLKMNEGKDLNNDSYKRFI